MICNRFCVIGAVLIFFCLSTKIHAQIDVNNPDSAFLEAFDGFAEFLDLPSNVEIGVISISKFGCYGHETIEIVKLFELSGVLHNSTTRYTEGGESDTSFRQTKKARALRKFRDLTDQTGKSQYLHEGNDECLDVAIFVIRNNFLEACLISLGGFDVSDSGEIWRQLFVFSTSFK